MRTLHWIAVGCHGVESPMTTEYYCAIFPFCGGGKKKDDKKTKASYDWATTGIPVKSYEVEIQNGFPCISINQESEEERGGSGACLILWQRGRALKGARAFLPGNRLSEEFN